MKEDRKAKSDLILAISPSELPHIKGCIIAREVWEKLKSVYASKGPVRKPTLMKQLLLQKLDDNGNIRDHLMKFLDAVDKLKGMEISINKELLAILLLYSLPSSFENFRCAIETRDILPDPDVLKVKILEESESRMQNRQANEPSSVLMARQKVSKPKKEMLKEKPRFKYRCYKCRFLPCRV